MKCSGIRKSLRNCKDFICKTCSTVPGDGDHFSTCIAIDGDEFETFSEFCFFVFFVTLFIVDYICTLCHPIHTYIYHGVI